jgi:glycosyltransferase involved in cell wall biosynthesis
VNLEREEEVINLLNSLSMERSRLVEMGKRARKVYEELFSWDRVMPEYLNLIEDLIEQYSMRR